MPTVNVVRISFCHILPFHFLRFAGLKNSAGEMVDILNLPL
jgi:hypothetical protein